MVLPRTARTTNQGQWLRRLFWGLLSGLLAAGLALLTGSLLVYMVSTVGNLDIDSSSFIHIFHYLSMGLGAFHAARYIGRLGWLSGIVVAATYFILLTWWLEGSPPYLAWENIRWIKQLGIAAGIGAMGGIIGVNLAP